MSIISEADVFNAISDKKSLDLFKSIVMAKAGDTDIYRKKIKLTRKQYYSRMSRTVSYTHLTLPTICSV